MIPVPDASPGFYVFVEANLNENIDEPSNIVSFSVCIVINRICICLI